MTKGLLSLITILFLFFGNSCVRLDDYAHNPNSIDGFSPVYLGIEDITAQIKSSPARDLKNTGRVYLYKSYLLVVEKDSGIHVLDNNSSTLESLGFIEVAYIRSLSIKDDVLYVQLGFGLMYIDINNFPTVEVLGILKSPGNNSDVNLDLLREKANDPWGTIYFECPTESNKIVVDWIPKRLEKPKCYIE